ncbi:hypothetical protein [Stigmatella aurantiaca]|uniref:hypothetical protein n=1 Tax=Stigmatella aurantiaca TaxID=41 RepID=UPI0011D2938B|nr:hypothetical protein [Stigmatella aurantiaca]
MMVFHFETPRPDELATQWKEAELVAAACKLAGHRFHTAVVLNARELEAHLAYIFTWKPASRGKPQFSLHFSGHADREGIQVGATFLDWHALASAIGRTSVKAQFPYMLFISGCGEGRPEFTKAFKGVENRPIYIFAFEDEVNWQDAAHASSLVYRFLSDIAVSDSRRVRKVVDQIRTLGLGRMLYYRWDKQSDCYRLYPGRTGASTKPK